MPEHTVTPLRPRASSGYTDTAALNDIHALLTTQDPGDATLAKDHRNQRCHRSTVRWSATGTVSAWTCRSARW